MGIISKNPKTKKSSVKTFSATKLNQAGLRKVLTLSEDESLRTGIKKYGHDAFKVSLSKGIAVTVLEGNNICKISPDGKRKVIAQISNSGVKVTRRSFKIE